MRLQRITTVQVLFHVVQVVLAQVALTAITIQVVHAVAIGHAVESLRLDLTRGSMRTCIDKGTGEDQVLSMFTVTATTTTATNTTAMVTINMVMVTILVPDTTKLGVEAARPFMVHMSHPRAARNMATAVVLETYQLRAT